jgi:capsular exopolysaccharide synthesis family protein
MDTPDLEQIKTGAAAAQPPSTFERLFGSEAQLGIDLIEIRNILRRRRSIIVACAAIVTTIATAYVYQITPRYTAEASLMLDQRQLNVIDLKDVLPGFSYNGDDLRIRSEMEEMKTAPIATRVVQALNLTQDPEFNPRLARPTPYQQFVAYLRSLAGLNRAQALTVPVPPNPKEELIATARALLGHVEIDNDGKSYLIEVKIQSENPKSAATVANAYADAYLLQQLDSKFEAVSRANSWLSDHLTDLKGKVEASDRAVQDFRAAHNLIPTNGNATIIAQQVTELNTQLILAKADLTQKETNVNEIEAQVRQGGLTAATQAVNSSFIEGLRKQESDLLVQAAQLATRYRPEHPTMININAQIADIKGKIAAEAEKYVRSMQGEVDAARAKVEALSASLQTLQKSVGMQDQASVQLAELQRQSDANRALYQDFLNRFGQTSSQTDMQQPDARVVATAFVPSAPTYPQKSMTIALAFVSSLVLGVILAFGVEQLDHGFRTADQVEKLTQVPVLGIAPDFAADITPQDAVVERPISSYAEAIRTIRTSLRYSDVDHPPKVVLVTSALPEEGKSVFSLSLARSVARSGRKALMIDCDLRRPSLKKLLQVEGEPGILNAFAEGGDIQSAIRVEEGTGLHYIVSTSGTPNPQDLLGSNTMRAILDTLRAQYDMIVLDSPPVLAVSDALVLSHIADTTMFLVRWGHTPRPVAHGALKTFRVNGGNLAGVVLSRVDYKKHANYYYGDTGYYYGHYGKRYGDRYGSYGES